MSSGDGAAKPSGSLPWSRIAVLIVVVAALYLLGHAVAEALVHQFDLILRAGNEPVLHRIIMAATVVYIVFTAMPFVPGAEIGLGMMLVFGAKICFLVYVSTVVALTLAYLAGRFIPVEIGAQAFGFVGLTRAQRLMGGLAALSTRERVDFLLNSSPPQLVRYLLRYRFLALAVLFNLPGNTLVGGGGGIALLAGMTRLFPFPLYLLTVAVAVSPVPLIISFTELKPWW